MAVVPFRTCGGATPWRFCSHCPRRPHSVRRLLREVGIAAALRAVARLLLQLIALPLRTAAPGRDLQFMHPHRGRELACWIALSLRRYLRRDDLRGYLRRQSQALTKSAACWLIRRRNDDYGSLHQTSKVVRQEPLRKPVAFRNSIAIHLCNSNCSVSALVEVPCRDDRLRNSLRPSGEVSANTVRDIHRSVRSPNDRRTQGYLSVSRCGHHRGASHS